jgi:predicted DNA-binding transcriptional regulator YafY
VTRLRSAGSPAHYPATAMAKVNARPQNKQALARMLELLKLLPEKPPGKTALELHRTLEDSGYEVTLRSVQRDLVTLGMPFAITCDEDDTPQKTQRWYWMAHASSGIAAITRTESIALLLVEQFLTGLAHKNLLVPLERRLDAARKFITAASGSAKTPWTHKFLSAPREYSLKTPAFKGETLATILDALFAERQVQVLYESLNDKQTGKGERWRTLHPYVLLFKGPVAYLVAKEHDAPNAPVKQFAIHRILDVRATNKPCERDGFDFAAYRDLERHELGEKKDVLLKLRLRHLTIEKVLSESALADSQRIYQEGGATIVEARVRDTNPLRRWLLGQGDRIEVLAPAALRQYMKEQLASAGSYYRPGRPTTHPVAGPAQAMRSGQST